MTAKSHSQGCEIEYDTNNGKWVYSDTKESVAAIRECIKCGCKPTKEGYDSCLGCLRGVKSACCGHGVENPYVVLNNGKHLRFKNIEEMKKYFYI